MTQAKPPPRRPHVEAHTVERIGWLRAAVLGSNDAIVSTASLMIGVGASAASKHEVLVAGVAGLVAGAMSMAAGEYVSVSSQRDAERATIEIEKRELSSNAEAELRELAGIYVRRGLDEDLAMKVAEQLSARDRLGAHLRDELGIEPTAVARPLQASWVSAVSFACFAAIPVLALLVAPDAIRVPVLATVSLASLAGLGALGARFGGARTGRAALRVVIGGAFAMAVAAGIGRLLGVAAG